MVNFLDVLVVNATISNRNARSAPNTEMAGAGSERTANQRGGISLIAGGWSLSV
jgi:hypothetical protein